MENESYYQKNIIKNPASGRKGEKNVRRALLFFIAFMEPLTTWMKEGKTEKKYSLESGLFSWLRLKTKVSYQLCV